MAKSGGRVKVSSGGRLFFSRVSRNGRVQRAFAEQIGRPVGGCVRSGVQRGMSGGQIHNVVRECAKQAKGTRLNLQVA